MATIGTIKNEERRATKKEEPFVGLQRENIGERFSDPESIPIEGPTVPKDRPPSISETTMTQPPRRLQEAEFPEKVNIYHREGAHADDYEDNGPQAEIDPEMEESQKSKLRGHPSRRGDR